MSNFSLLRRRKAISIEASFFSFDRALESVFICEKWHKDEFEIVQVLERVLGGQADVAEVLSKAQSCEGWRAELGLTDAEAALLGWRPELWGD